MENSNNKNFLFIAIFLIVIIVASFATIIFLDRDKDSKTQINQASDNFTIIDQKGNAVIKSKFVEKDAKNINYVTIEYNNYILKTFFDEPYPEDWGRQNEYKIEYLSDNYLSIRITGGYEGIPSDLLFDLSNFREEKPSLDGIEGVGTYKFYENDTYVIFQGIGGGYGFGKDLLSVEFIDGKSILFISPTSKCILTEKPTTDDITIKDGIISFTERIYTDDGQEILNKRGLDINNFCKNQ
jgi:hypothetical protein